MASFRMRYWFAAIIGLLIVAPNLLATQHELYQGLPPSFSTDEYSYFSHTQEALLGRFGQAGKGITLESVDEPSFHLAPIEEFYGIAFGWTELKAAELFIWLDFAIPFLLFLVTFALARVLKFSEKEALIIASVFCLAQLYALNRPVNPRASTLVQLGALTALLSRKTTVGYIGALLMGALVGINVWGWTALWCFWALYLLYLIATKSPHTKFHLKQTVVAVIAALPFVHHMFAIADHPAHATASMSAGLVSYHLPESLAWSVLTLLITGAMIILWKKENDKTDTLPLLLLALTSLIVLNQQLIHGLVLQFRSHYAPFILLSACMCGVYAYNNRKSLPGKVLLTASLLLIGIQTYDNRYLVWQWSMPDEKFGRQHLASALPVLDGLDRSVILSDSDTSSFLAAFTHHDVLFTPYLQHTLISNERHAVQFCVTQLPSVQSSDEYSAEFTKHLLAINSQFDPFLREDLKTAYQNLVYEACESIKNGNHEEILEEKSVSYLFWNKKSRPNWRLEQLEVNLTPVAEGEGWSLWKV